MLGILYLFLGVMFGYAVCESAFPHMREAVTKTFTGKELSLSSYFVRIPAWVLSGVIPLTWVTYLTAYVLKVVFSLEYPLLTADILAMVLFFCLTAALLFFRYRREKKAQTVKSRPGWFTTTEWIFFGVLLVFFTQLIFCTFSVKDGNLNVGFSVYSDFAPHMGMIRSFSYGNNFPTAYSHFAGEDIRYHFLFQFLVGNLELLGMRVDLAFNLPSIFGLLATCMLLYALAVRITGKHAAGYLTTLFFVFRSSPSFFRFLAELPKGEIWQQLKTRQQFIEYTQNEGWGLWNLNVYCNQRHLAFALAVMLLAFHYFLPYVYEMAEKLSRKREELSADTEEKARASFGAMLAGYGKTFFFTKTAFGVKHPLRSLLLGVLLGALAFFNGSVLTACCAVLFFLAAVSDYRLDYLISAGTALVLSLLESKLFIAGSAVSPKYQFGFLAANKTFFGVLDYMWQLWGILLLFLGAYLLLGRGVKRYLVFVFSVPLLMAFTVSLTPDITVNHKFVMMAEMLLSVFPAEIIAVLFEKQCTFLKNRLVMRRITAVLLTVFLTITGFFEYFIIQRQYQAVYDMEDPRTVWFRENTDSDDIILSAPYALNEVVLGGAMLYYGHAYYAMSAGYDTYTREEIVEQMYEARTPAALDALIQEHGIDYIIVDRDARESVYFNVREYVIAATYEAVYTYGEEEDRFTVYDTGKKLVQ
ncbi:MAG: hypothetical protein PUC73_05490 [Lachnospiraceae bacterium]|nr:hypothetical protein [Lachnospiraceae bacterium]